MKWLNRYRLTRVFSRRVTSTSTKKRPARLNVEALESRDVPATFTVTSLGPVNEGGGSQAAFLVTLNSPAGTCAVDYATASGTATQGTDYAGTTGTVYLDATTPTATVYVTPDDDGDNEGDETFVLELSNPVGATLAGASATTTILDDEFPQAVPDSLLYQQGAGPFHLDVLANDTGAGPGGFTITAVADWTGPSGTLAIDSGGQAVTFTPSTSWYGTATFTYTMEDEFGSEASAASVTVRVNAPPGAVDDAFNTQVNTSFTSSVGTNDGDPDGTSLTFSLATGPSHGSVSMASNGTFSYAPDDNYVHGPDTFTYEVDDGYGGTSAATVTVTIDNRAPVAVNDGSYETHGVTPVSGNVLANDYDPDGDSLGATVTGGPGHGTVTMDPNGDFVYTPDAGYHGPDSFTYEAADSYDGTSTAEVVTIIVNSDPVAVDDTFYFHGGATGSLLGNDSDPDGDGLSASAQTISTAAGGTITISSDGSFGYTPPYASFSGTESFSYSIFDEYGGESAAYVNFIFQNNNPAAIDDEFRMAVDAG